MSPWAVAIGLAAAIGVSAACDDTLIPERCGPLPAGGCPRAAGDACLDRSCSSVHSCSAGRWIFDHACPPRDAAAALPDASTEGGARPADAAIDAEPGAFGGPGCADLQAPDCSLGMARGCPTGCCGCEDVFACRSGGWARVGGCDGGSLSLP